MARPNGPRAPSSDASAPRFLTGAVRGSVESILTYAIDSRGDELGAGDAAEHQAIQHRQGERKRPHEAWNDSGSYRVVLFVDFVRPLRSPARWLNAAVLWAIAFSPFIGDAKRRHNDWEKRFEEMKERRAAAARGAAG